MNPKEVDPPYQAWTFSIEDLLSCTAFPESSGIEALVGVEGYEVFALETNHGWRQDTGFAPEWDRNPPTDCAYFEREVERVRQLGLFAHDYKNVEKFTHEIDVLFKSCNRITVQNEFAPLVVQAFDAQVRIPLAFAEQLALNPADIVELEKLPASVRELLSATQALFRWKAQNLPTWLIRPLDLWINECVPWERRTLVVNFLGWLHGLRKVMSKSEMDAFLQQERLIPVERWLI